MDHQSLETFLAAALPKGSHFILHHISTPPTECPAIFAAPPGEKAERTRCENHFLSLSIHHEGKQVQVYAIEVLIYTTTRLTTLFVSKADSTGYLHLLNLPLGTPSPLRSVTQTFLQYLVQERELANRRLVVSLFARAQNQYLFPGSIENKSKHVLDDRGLIKWWCRNLDVVLQHGDTNKAGAVADASSHEGRLGYLRVPGYDLWETRALVPKDSSKCSVINDRWKVADPLVELAGSKDLPERCLIPRFPDDPKARFLDTLDEELPEDGLSGSQSLSQESLKRVNDGRWRSIRSLEQFWEAMSFRQECSSGRLVGFLWAVFTPAGFDPAAVSKKVPSLKASSEANGLVVEEPDCPSANPETLAKEQDTDKPGDQTDSSISDDWPLHGRGEIVLKQSEYGSVGETLLSLDYATIEVAVDSTKKWSDKVASIAGRNEWGKIVTGEREVLASASTATNGNVTAMLSAGLIRKKKRPIESVTQVPESANDAAAELAAEAIRKKLKSNGVEPNVPVVQGIEQQNLNDGKG